MLFRADACLQGLFGGQLIIETYALAHLPVVESLPQDLCDLLAEHSDTHPRGALATAVLAVRAPLLLRCMLINTISGRVRADLLQDRQSADNLRAQW